MSKQLSEMSLEELKAELRDVLEDAAYESHLGDLPAYDRLWNYAVKVTKALEDKAAEEKYIDSMPDAYAAEKRREREEARE